VNRVYGYYAQDMFEQVDEDIAGIIMWNTYMHDATVEGTITIGNRTFVFENSPRFRAYGDMNWGCQFPHPPPTRPTDNQFAWGWYYASVPNPQSTKNDISIIAGTGVTYAGFPLYTMDGRFADIRFNSTFHIEAREIVMWEESILKQVFRSTNDGTVMRFQVQRSNWTTYKDKFGEALIPMRQVLTIETTNYLIVMDFTSVQSNYNRLLFPFNNNIFSDFEGLGVPATVQVKHKPTGDMLLNSKVNDGGLEYGFNFKMNPAKQQ